MLKKSYKEINDTINIDKSFNGYTWKINETYNEEEDLVNYLAKQRNIDINVDHSEQIEKFHELFKSTLRDLDRAIDLINKYDSFAVVGDYDVDGIISTAQIVLLANILKKKVVPFIPNRFTDGYGLSNNIVDNIIEKKIPLVFTVDNGTTAYEQLKKLKEHDVKIVIIDHHVLQKDIEIDAFLNPHLISENNDFKDLAASGLVFFFVKAVLEKLNITCDLGKFMGLAAMGTICDMVPLRQVNSSLVKEGFVHLNKNTPKWITEILPTATINEKNVGFIIGPILNVAGRFGVAYLSLKILICDNDDYKNIVKNLQFKISQRRLIEEEIRYDICGDKMGQKIRKKIPNNFNEQWPLLLDTGKIMIFAHHSWHEGVLGIVAGNMKDLFNKTVILLTKQNNIFKGSIRSVKGLHVGDLINQLQKNNIILQGGGHEMAGGIVLKDLEGLFKFCKNYPITNKYKKEINIDAVCSLKCVNNEFYDQLQLLGPFGMCNPEVVFLFVNCIIVKIYQNANKNFSVFFFSHPNTNIIVPAYVNNRYLEKFLTLNRRKSFLILGKIIRFNKKNHCQFQIIDIKIQNE